MDYIESGLIAAAVMKGTFRQKALFQGLCTVLAKHTDIKTFAQK